ncbi:MAG: hypothetical protein V7603_4684 [Micromonosporaceae bacterium]
MTGGRRTWLTAADGTRLAMRHWTSPRCRAAVFYIHGIQSHSGWLFETGPRLVRLGIEVYALDRRGSGASGGLRGHLPSWQAVLDDYATALREVRARCAGRPVTALGQSLGGSILAASLCAPGPAAFDRVVFCAPALGQQRSRHGDAELARLRRQDGTRPVPVDLADRHYTEEPRYLDFMAADPLILRSVTARTRATLVAIEDVYWAWSDRGNRFACPVALAVPEEDPIIDTAQSRLVLARLAPQLTARSFATRGHYLEFTSERSRYWEWVAGIAGGACPVGAGGRTGVRR